MYAENQYAEWEFKTVHSHNGEFASPYHLRVLIQQESVAGWTFMDQVSSRAVRFRRPVSVRAWDHLLPEGVDPYRTIYTYTAGPELELLNLLLLSSVAILIILGVVVLTVLFALPF